MATGAEAFFAGVRAREEQGRASVFANRLGNPDQAARANIIARQTGEPADAIERNFQEIEARERARKAASQVSPTIAPWMANPRNAAAAHDDVGVLSWLGDAFKGTDVGRSALSAVRGFAPQITRGAQAVVDFQDTLNKYNPLWWLAHRLTGKTPLQGASEALGRVSRQEEAKADALAPKGGGFAARGINSAVQSTVGTLPSLITGIASPAAGLAVAGAATFGSSYGEGKEAGLSSLAALRYAGTDAAIEMGTEKIPFFNVLNDARVGTPFLKRLARNLVEENVGEQTATFGQDLNKWLSIEANQGKTFGQFLRERAPAAIDTLIATTVSSGAINVGIEAALQTSDRLTGATRQREAAEAERDQLTQIMGQAAQSKLRERDPEAFRAFLDEHADEAGSNILVPAEKLRELMQTDYEDDPALAEFFQDYSGQIDRAEAIGTDVVIPLSDAATRLAGTKLWDAMADHARMSPGGMSAAEAKAYEEDYAAEIDKRTDEAEAEIEADRSAAAPAQRVYQDVFDQVRSTGAGVREAGVIAELWAQRYETRAQRLGTEPAGIRLYHGSPNQALSLDDVQIIGGEGRKQGKKGRSYGGFYAADESSITDAEGYAGEGGKVYAVDLKPDAVMEEKQGDITRLSEQTINEYRARGVDVVKGKDPRGRTEYAIINRDAIVRIADRNAPSQVVTAWDAYRASNVTITRDAPEAVRGYAKADQLDVLINAMRRGAEAQKPTDPSLLEWITKNGGIEDVGGDIASMGGNEWHKGKPFRKRLIRSPNDPGFLPSAQENANSPDELALRAWEAGYFPDATERPDVNALLDAIGEELRGAPRRPLTKASEGQAAAAAAADELRAFLANRGIDPDTATKADIAAAVAEREEGGRELEQDGRPDPSWARSVDRVVRGERPSRDLRLGSTPAVLRLMGMSDGDMFMSADKLGRVRREHPEVSLETLRNLPRLLAEPASAFPSARNDGSIIVAVEAKDVDGNPIIVPITVETGAARNVVLTTYGKEDGARWIANQLAAAKREGKTVYEKNGPAATKPETAASEEALPPGPIPIGRPAEPERKILTLRDVVNKRTLDQSARGRLQILNDGRNIIQLFDSANLSTLLHESGHLWLEELQRDAAESPAVAEQWQVVQDWFAADGHPVVDGVIPTEAHEMWARGIERYFMEGKAPSAPLQRAFTTFRAWLLRIYEIVARLNTPLTPEVRNVMDRLLATDDAIAQAGAGTAAQALFTDAAQAGMTDEEFAVYRGSVTQARDEAFDALLFRTMETVRRARTKEWKDQRAALRDTVAKEIGNRPEFRALAILRSRDPETRVQLSRADIVEEYGADILAMLPKGVPPTVVDEGGVHPDALAEQVGFSTGWELLSGLAGIQTRAAELKEAEDKRSPLNEAIDLETDRLMNERHGDVLSDGSIEEEALAAIHNDTRASVIASEVRALGRKRGEVPTPWALAKAWAIRTVRSGTVFEQTSAGALARHQRNEAKANRAALDAILKGNTDEAFNQKQKELLNHALYRAAKEAKDETDGIVKRLSKLAKAKTLPSMDQDYLDRIHELLEAYDFRYRSQRAVTERASFAEWVVAKREAGEDVYVPPRLEDSGNVHFSRLTVDELTALDDAIQSIAHLGRMKKKLLLAQEERDFEEVIDEALAGAADVPDLKASNDRNPKRWNLTRLHAELVKVEAIADDMDDGNPNGVFNRVLIRGATDAANLKSQLTDSVLKPLADLYLNMPRLQQKRLRQKVTVPEFLNPATGEATTFTRMELLAVALNTGNESNLDKLLRGEGWSQQGVDSVLARELNEEDWRFVEAVWRQIDTLWPEIARSERDLTGVVPEKVAGREVQTPFGTITGGYYPMVYDPTRGQRGANNAEDDAAGMFGQIGSRIATSKGHTITRTSFAAPVLLSVEGVLFGHVNKVTTRIAYQRYVRDALKFIQDPRIREITTRKLGRDLYEQVKPWLQRQVNAGTMATRDIQGWEKVMRQFRINATLVGLGFRFTTMAAQVSGLANSAALIGPRWVATGAAEFAASPIASKAAVFAASPELSRRAEEFDRDIGAAFAQMSGRSSPLDKARAFAFWGIGFIDVHMVALPTWLGAYRKALSEGMGEQDAAAYGDKVVRMSQSSGRAKDLAAIQDSSEFARIATMFYSFFNVLYNQQRTAVRAAKRGDWRKASQISFFTLVLGPLMGALLTGQGPDDEEEPEAWALRKVFFGMWAGIPLVRDVMGVAERKAAGQYAGTPTIPVIRAAEAAIKLSGDAKNAATGEEVSDKWIKHAIETPGYFVGLPTGQVGTTAQFLYDVNEGAHHPEDAAEWYRGLTKGKVDAE